VDLPDPVTELACLVVGQRVRVPDSATGPIQRHRGTSGIVVDYHYDEIAVSGILLRVQPNDDVQCFLAEPKELHRADS
jgi:hypothetical protein